jgi:hypothetical protein
MKRCFALPCLVLAVVLPSAAVADSGIQRVPCGYQQILSLSSAQALTIPTTCGGPPTLATITAEAQAVRYRDDATAPTAAVGMPLAVGTSLTYQGTLSKIRFIEQTSGAKLNILFYR